MVEISQSLDAALPYFVAALLPPHQPHWGPAIGQSTTVSFSFMASPPMDELSLSFDRRYGDPFASFRPFTESQRVAVRQALAAWSEVCGLTFAELDGLALAGGGRGMIEFGRHAMSFAGYAYYPSVDASSGQPLAHNPGGDVLINAGYGDVSPGTGGYATLLHEIGHALGFKHTGDYGTAGSDAPFLPETEDHRGNSVMSYLPAPHPTAGLGLFDMIAAQYYYGPNLSVRTGDDLYVFGHSHLVWDGSGADTL